MSSKSPEKEERTRSDVASEVHSANSWETADLGDKQRNEKFLRLMGANKKEHHGKIVIGENKPAHKRDRQDLNMEDNLTEQYQQGLEHRLIGGKKGHLGLGYHPDSSSDSKDNDTDEARKTDGDHDKEDKGEERGQGDGAESEETAKEEGDENGSQERNERKRESIEDADSSAPDVKKMKFVKSSS